MLVIRNITQQQDVRSLGTHKHNAGLLLTKRRTEINLEIPRRTLEAASGTIDFLWMGENLGTQVAPIISLDLYRKTMRPLHQRFVKNRVTREIPSANMATLSGTFLCKVFEGPYRDMRKWIEDMKAFVSAKGKHLRKRYCFYTTCPTCAKLHGANYVVILAQV